MATGLYDPAYEHDACGVGMVADLHGRPDHDIVDKGLTVLERLAHRGASGAEVYDRRRRRHPGPGAAPVPGRRGRGGRLHPARRRRLRRRPGLLAPRRRRRRQGPRTWWPPGRRGGPAPCSGWRVVPDRDRGPRARPPGRHAAHRAALRAATAGRGRRHHGPRAPGLRAAQAGRARRRRALLPVAVGPHHRLQGHAHLRAAAHVLPRPARPHASSRAWPWCTRASRPTRSRAGRWPTRTATWATTARSTRWPATATGCGPARPCSTTRSSRATWRASTRSARRGPATRPASTRCSSCCTSAGAPCPTPCS